MNIALFFDTETTGLPLYDQPSDDPRQPHIVQLGALLVDLDSRRELSCIDVIVKPDGWTIPDDVASIHGITTEHAMESGNHPQTRHYCSDVFEVDPLIVTDGQPMRLDGPGLQAVRAVLEDYQAALECLPARTMVRCHRMTEKRIREIFGRIDRLPDGVHVMAI